MARKVVSKASPLSFGASDYVAAVAAVIKSGNAIDKANGNAAAAVQTWAVASATGIKVNALTIEDVKAKLIAATPIATRKANHAANGDAVDSIAACGSTVKGWYYSFNRIVKGNALDRLINGEAFTTLARNVSTVQTQSTGKRAKAANDAAPAKGKTETAAALPALATTPLHDIVKAMVAELKRLSVPVMADKYQADIATGVSALATATRAIEAHIRAKAEKAAAAPKATRVRKAA